MNPHPHLSLRIRGSRRGTCPTLPLSTPTPGTRPQPLESSPSRPLFSPARFPAGPARPNCSRYGRLRCCDTLGGRGPGTDMPGQQLPCSITVPAEGRDPGRSQWHFPAHQRFSFSPARLLAPAVLPRLLGRSTRWVLRRWVPLRSAGEAAPSAKRTCAHSSRTLWKISHYNAGCSGKQCKNSIRQNLTSPQTFVFFLLPALADPGRKTLS